MFFPVGTFWKDWKSTRYIWFIWQGDVGAGGREREVQVSVEGDGLASEKGLGRGKLRSTGDGGTLKQNQPYYPIQSLYDVPSSNMGASGLIWVRISDMELGYLGKGKAQGGGGGG